MSDPGGGTIKERTAARPTVKQHLAAIRMLFDWLVAFAGFPSGRVTFDTVAVRQPCPAAHLAIDNVLYHV